MDNDGTIKLADFGAAKQLAGLFLFEYFHFFKFIIICCSFASDIVKSYVTTVTGTPYWMAPEVIQESKSYGRKADIWSLGAVVIEMITGKPPFYDLTPMSALFKLGSTDILPDIPDSLSPEGKDFLSKCFQRYSNNLYF